MDTFCVELVSNSSFGVYPNNTLASSKTHLPEDLVFRDKWEVALLEVSYPGVCYNITDGRFLYIYNYDKENSSKEFYLPSGHYENPEVVLETMKRMIGYTGSKKIKTFFTYVLDRQNE